MPTSIRFRLNAGMPVISQVGADRVHILYGEVVYGTTSIIGKSCRIVLTDAELLELYNRVGSHLTTKGIHGESVRQTSEAIQSVHPSDSGR